MANGNQGIPVKQGQDPKQQVQGQQQGGQSQGIGGMMPPPAQGDPEFEDRKNRWRQTLDQLSQQPGVSRFLVDMGTQMMQPVGADESLMGNLGEATQGALQNQQKLQQQQQEEQRAQQQMDLKQERVEQQGERIDLQEQGQEQEQEQFETKMEQTRQELGFEREQWDERLQYMRDKMGNDFARSIMESAGQGGPDFSDKRKLLTDIRENVREQYNNDKNMMDPKAFRDKWGSGYQDDVIQSYRASLSTLTGQRDEDVDDSISVSGEELKRAGAGWAEEGQTYSLAPEQANEVEEQLSAPEEQDTQQQDQEAGQQGQQSQTTQLSTEEAQREYNSLLREAAQEVGVDPSTLDARIKSGTEGSGSIGTDFFNMIANIPGVEGRNITESQEAQDKVRRLRELNEAITDQ